MHVDMLDKIFENSTVEFLADGYHGGGDDDPWDHDEHLARAFKGALHAKILYNSDTANPFGLIDRTEDIIERVESVGKLLIMLAPTLRPIAERILQIPGYSDKRNPGILADKFKGFDLTLDP